MSERHPETFQGTMVRLRAKIPPGDSTTDFLWGAVEILCGEIDDVIAENARLKQRVEALERRPAGETRFR